MLALCHARVRGLGSEVVVDVPFAHVIEVRDGKAVAFEMYSRVDDARASVGLPARVRTQPSCSTALASDGELSLSRCVRAIAIGALQKVTLRWER